MAACGANWVDSIWATMFIQWNSRNFIGMVVKPSDGSLKWIQKAFNFGVPIWVEYLHPKCYEKQEGLQQDGAHVMAQWQPTLAQVQAVNVPPVAITAPPRIDPTATPPQQVDSTTTPPPDQQTSITAPEVIPAHAQWYPSWKEFFHKCDQDNERKWEEVSDADKQSWKSRVENAKTFSEPGKKGPSVRVWEICELGGFFRELLSRHDATIQWDSFNTKELLFNPQSNTWDYCSFMYKPKVKPGAPDDMNNDNDNDGPWFAVEDLPSTLLKESPLSPLEFLYLHYGFLSVEPVTPATTVLALNNAAVHHITGLAPPENGNTPPHLIRFVSDILQTQLPTGHCDISPDSPPNERLLTLMVSSIYRSVFWSPLPEILDRQAFILFNSPNTPILIVVHNSLSIF